LKADVSVRSGAEIEAAIRSLSDAQWIRLRKASRYFGWVYGLGEDDLLQEAFCRSLAGSRKCPSHVDIVKFLVEAMRSIANGEIEKVENSVDTLPIDDPGTLDTLQDGLPLQDEGMIVAESEEAIRKAILGLFPDDQQARDIADGILAGYEGQELRQLTDLDETSYASKRRYMRRTIDRHISRGKKK
jgi:DNA-directed RNA polymerase specialized sigma24 family protein